SHGRDRPEADSDGEPDSRADAIHQPARIDIAERVRELKRDDDVAVVDLAPSEPLLERRLENADHLAVDVVDRGGEEQQRADRPAKAVRAGGRDWRRARPGSWQGGHTISDGGVSPVNRELAMPEALGGRRRSRADVDELLHEP